MYLIVTKTFPPEIGGMQNLMWGLANELSKHYMIKVFADYYENHKLLTNVNGMDKIDEIYKEIRLIIRSLKA